MPIWKKKKIKSDAKSVLFLEGGDQQCREIDRFGENIIKSTAISSNFRREKMFKNTAKSSDYM